MTNQQLTPAEIRLAQYGQRTSTWSTATYNDGTEKALHEIALGLKAEVDRLRAVLADAWVPCSPAWIAANPGQCPSTPRVPGPEGVSHLHPAVLGEDVVDEMSASLARDGFGDDEIADMLGPGVTDGEAPEPIQLRWGLDDVMWGDDDSVIVMMSGPGREPYRLELDPERAAVLRQNLAGPDEEPRRALTASEYNAAWHAVEGAAGQEGADPGTVLHAVLDRLGIAWQDAAYPGAAASAP